MKKLLPAIALMLASLPAFAQIGITYQNPDSLYVCGQDTFFVFLKNNGAAPSAALSVEISTNPGITYVPASISGAAEGNISNLEKPVFSTAPIAAGQTLTLKMRLAPDCSVVAGIDMGIPFLNKIEVLGGGGQPVSTINFKVETSLTVIQSVSPADFTGMIGDQFQRTVLVKNTRYGKISTLHFTDERDKNYIAVSVPGGAVVQNTGTLFQADFDGNFIKNFGDGDEFFEKDEVVSFVETVTITDCGYPPPAASPKDAHSKIRVGWGCNSEVCRYDSTNAPITVHVLKSDKVPNIIYDVKAAPPLNRCGEAPATQRILLKNIGLAPAPSVIFELEPPVGVALKGGFLPSSFRLVSAAGAVSPLFPVLTTAIDFPICNKKFSTKATLSLPAIAAGDSLWVEADLYNCQDICEPVAQDISANLFYTKDCPPNGFDSKQFFVTGQSVDSTGFQIATIIKTDIGTCIGEGGGYPYEFLASSNLFTTLAGALHFRMWLPPGLSLDPACVPKINGNAPISITQTGQVLTITAALPLDSSNASMPFCLKYLCNDTLPCISAQLDPHFDNIDLPIPDPGDSSCFTNGIAQQCDQLMMYMASITKLPTDDPDCGLSACNKIFISVVDDCGGNGGGTGGGPTGPSGGGGAGNPSAFVSDFKTERINFGLSDKNGDRSADLPLANASPDPNLRRDRVMTGDTVRLTFSGTVTMGGGYTGFPLKFYHELVQSDMLLNGADKYDLPSGQSEFVNADTGYMFVAGRLRVKYANGTAATCPILAPTHTEDGHLIKLLAINISPVQEKDVLISESHEFDLSLPVLSASGCLPKGTLDLGDSIFVETDYKIRANFVSAPPPVLPNPPLINIRNAQGWIGNRQFAWDFYPHKLMQYSGFKERLAPNTFGIRPCENSVEPRPLRYSMLVARPDLFPNEVRPLSKIIGYKQSAPNALALQSAMLRYLVLQDSVPVLKDFPLSATKIGPFYEVDFGPIYSPPVDEGYIFSTKIVWLPECNFMDPDTSVQFVKFMYPPCFFDSTIVDVLYENAIGFYANTAVLKATSAPVATSQTGKFDIPVSLKNLRVSPAANSWVYFTDSLGTASDFEILLNGSPLPDVNGVFQIGSIGSFSEKNLTVKLRSKSCVAEKLLLIYGWSCAPLTAPPTGEEACGKDTIFIEIQNLATELDLGIVAEPAQIPLCAESDYFEIEVFNAKIGHAFDVLASVKLPQGLSVAPGSVQVSYPAGAGWQAVADPAALAGNLYLWEINDLLPSLASEGLPGVDEFPKNKILLRFRVIAECGFVAESQPIFATEGTEPCGARTNNLKKAGDPIHLAGVQPSYSAQVSLGAAGAGGPVSCGETVKLNAQISLTGAPQPGDSIIIVLPPGVSYVAGSYAAGLGGPTGPPIFSGNKGRLELSTSTSTPFINFSFSIKYDAPVGCLDEAVLLQVISATTAICASTGQPCGVSVANGEAIYFLPTENPELSLTDFVIKENAPGVWGFDATVQNPSDVNAAQPLMQLFNDTNSDGLLDAGDVLLGSFTHNGGIAAGQSGHILGGLAGNPPVFCSLLAVFPAAENCACSPVVFPVSQDLTFEHLPLVFCLPVISQKFGVDSTAGSTYQWFAASGQIGCATCAMTGFAFPAGAQPGQPIELILLEKKGGCTRKHVFTVSFGAAFALTASDKVICKGEKTTLSAQSPAGGIFQWNGPGATGQTGQNLLVSPSQTAFYMVTVTLASGCTGMASVLIEVLPSDSVLLPKIVTCPGQPLTVFGQNVSQPGFYSKKFPKSNGCDSTVVVEVQFKPAPQTGEQLTICFGDTAIVNGQAVTQSGSFPQTFPAANGCDSTHTISVNVLPKLAVPPIDTIFAAPGDTVHINAPGGFSSYEWDYPFVNCGGCTSPFFVVDSAGTYHFKLTVTNSGGCTGEIVIVVRGSAPCDPASLLIPNAFTPDGDGVNDVFKPVPPEGAETIARLRIYDRWGEKIYDKTGADVGWDGNIHGKAAPMDVYVWILDVTCASIGEDGQRVGDVTLIR